MIRKLILGALAATTLAGPVLADPHWGHDRRELRDDRHELRGDRNEFRRDRVEYGRDRDEFRRDRFDSRNDRREWRFEGNRFREPWVGYPRGYGYRAWGIGAPLPQAYWGQRYWIGQPDYYRLPQAWRGTRWVRVGPDALLIRLYDGLIVRAVRSVYW